MTLKIYFSPSDQTGNRYATGNTNEAVECRKIALAAVKAAERCGFEAKTNTTDDSDDAMVNRVNESNAWGADLHVPIHTNAFNGQVKGTRMFCYAFGGDGHEACQSIMGALAPITPGESDSITEWSGLYEVRAAYAPTAYIEVAFHDNVEEADFIISNTEEIAEAIVRGICNYFGVKYVAPAPKNDVLYRVQVGAFSVRSNAERLRDELKKNGSDAFIVGG